MPFGAGPVASRTHIIARAYRCPPTRPDWVPTGMYSRGRRCSGWHGGGRSAIALVRRFVLISMPLGVAAAMSAMRKRRLAEVGGVIRGLRGVDARDRPSRRLIRNSKFKFTESPDDVALNSIGKTASYNRTYSIQDVRSKWKSRLHASFSFMVVAIGHADFRVRAVI